jgi:HlyD family secretion protein
MKLLKISLNLIKILLMINGFIFIAFILYRSIPMISFSDVTESAQFRVEKIKRGSIKYTISCTGTLSAVGTVEVGTQVSGTIKKVLVDYNDIVKKGQILAELDLERFNADLDLAKAKLIKFSALYKKAKAEYERNKPLHEQGHLASQEILAYETEKECARAELLSAKASLKNAKINLSNAQIRSPISGIILERNIEKGQTVAASYSTPTLFIIAKNLSNMEIETKVDESDIGKVKKGQDVIFSVQSYSDNQFHGTVIRIQMNPSEISNVVTYTVKVDAPNKSGKLLPGMTATADFVVEKAENELLVSNAALNFKTDNSSSDEAAIYVLDHDKPRRVIVSTGISNNTFTSVKGKGLDAGILVIIGKKIENIKEPRGLMSIIFPKPAGGKPGHGPGHGPHI